jgi:type 2 lantibiotic biosynthesis protein LanM
MSGLGGQAGQKTAIRGQSVSAVGTDEVRVTDATYTTGQVQNRPRLEGQTDVLPIHGDLLVEGFTDGYEILLDNKDELREFLNRFRTVQIRAVPRNTADYFQVLVNSYHPDVLGQPGYREQVTHSLEPAAKNFPNLGKLLPSERAQILEGDIPYFMTTPTSNDLLGGDGMVIKDSIAESGWSIFERKLERFGVDDLRLQRQILRASMASMFGFNTYRLSPIKLSKPYETYIDAARAIGDHLNEAAIRQSETLTWLSLESKGRHQLTNQNIYQVMQTGLGLYEGITGLGFFFDSLYKVTGDDQYEKTVEQVCRTLDHSPEMMNLTPSAFNGLGSLVYFFSHLGRVPAVENLANRMDPAKGAKVPDIISGHAGSILALLAGGLVSPTSLKKAIEFGDALVNFLKEGSTLPIQRGFSHGFGGLGFALEKLGERTGEERFLAASQQAFEKEDSLIKGENWTDPDYFKQNGGHHQATWCHGLPGLALARMSSRDSTARSFASMALAQMTNTAANHGLCHGALGNIDVFIEGAKHLPDGERWMMAAHTWGKKVLTETKERGLRTAFPLFFENPGLMTGLAGIGYGFLRLARPDLPCVLTLEGPSRSK